MNPGNIIAIAVLAVIVFFAGRAAFKEIRNTVTGKGCSGCSGSCSGTCPSCRVSDEDMDKARQWHENYIKEHKA